MKPVHSLALTGVLLAVATASAAQTQTEGSSQSPAPGSEQAPQLQSVGITLGYLNNPFFRVVADTTIERLRQLAGNEVAFTVSSGDYDLKLQRDQVTNFINAGIDLLILGAVDSQGIFPAVERAKEAGIPVVAVDVTAEGADATVMSDNRQAGRLGCEYIARRLEGSGKVVIINGPPVSAVADRVQGCQDVLTKHEGIEILSADRDAGGNPLGGMEVMITLLTQFERIDAVFAQNDPTAIGAELAARQAGRDEFFIVGVDGSPEVVERLSRAHSLLAATAAQQPRIMAARAAEVAYGLFRGQRPEEDTLLIPVELVTRDNMADYRSWEAD